MVKTRSTIVPALVASLWGGSIPLFAQTRSMAQDPSLDNLAHPPGYVVAAPGSLGSVRTAGTGPRNMILIPGLGFGGDVFDEFMARHAEQFTMRAVTLAGFGGTAGPPMPPPGTSYAALSWTSGAVDGILRLMDREKIEKATLVAHWALGTQIAIRLASEHPERFDALVLIAGVPRVLYSSPSSDMAKWSPEQRVKFADGMGEGWFKTVARRTWDDNNFMSYDYAVNPRRGLFLWREAATPSLQVWVRYLLEFYASDSPSLLKTLRVPTLVVKPGFDDPGFYVDDGRDYMRDLCLKSWEGVALSDAIETATISGSRLFVMYDRPEELDLAVSRFLGRRGAR
jgi:pimeloyl-ACP methyl ester carboxylesterase